jgi:hypothetical protein
MPLEIEDPRLDAGQDDPERAQHQDRAGQPGAITGLRGYGAGVRVAVGWLGHGSISGGLIVRRRPPGAGPCRRRPRALRRAPPRHRECGYPRPAAHGRRAGRIPRGRVSRPRPTRRAPALTDHSTYSTSRSGGVPSAESSGVRRRRATASAAARERLDASEKSIGAATRVSGSARGPRTTQQGMSVVRRIRSAVVPSSWACRLLPRWDRARAGRRPATWRARR